MKAKTVVLILPFLFLLACQSSTEETPANDLPSSGIKIIDEISAAIQNEPSNAGLYAARANAYYQNEGYDEAILDYQQALSLDSTNVDYLHGLADVYMDYYRSRQGLQIMEKAASFHPERIPTLLKLSEFQLILSQHTEALKTLDKVKAIDPLNSEMFYMAGLIMEDKGEIDPAIGNYQSAVENNPDLLEGWIALGKLWAQKDPQVAVHFFDNALRVDSTSLIALHEKALYEGNVLNDVPAAQETFKKLIKFYPQYEDAYYNSGLLYLDMDSIDLARRQFDLAIEIEPTFVQAYYYRGVTAELIGDQEGAKEFYEAALRLNADYPEAQDALNRLQ